MKIRPITFIILLMAMLALFITTACGSQSNSQTPSEATQPTAAASSEYSETTGVETTEADEKTDSGMTMDISTDDKSVDLPADYPSDLLPVYSGSFVESVVSLDKGFTIIAHSKDNTEQVSSFYKDIMKKGQITAESTVDGAYTVFGTLDKYTVQLTVGPEQDREEYASTFAIMIFPA